ncbi:unnamed protein product [Rotaria sp. Silwood2]|nr:unnamed protein product [Rotaria sp. Silwood2]CAF4307909.1 unnamed protein product [Rotaria sp. Silwood2]
MNESRARRRQKIAAHQRLTCHTLLHPTNEVIADAKDVPSNTEEFETWERCPVEKLMYYIEQSEKEDDEDPHNTQIKTEMTGSLHSPPDITKTYAKQEVASAVQDRPATVVTIKESDEEQNKMHCRYFDIGTLPKQTLLPITGYNKTPLMSLEDAIQSVHHLIDNIDVKVKVAKQNAQQRHGRMLSVEESAAIQLYTMEAFPLDRCLYYILNKTLRSANRRDLIPWFPYLKLLMTALWKLPPVRRTVWRGIKNVNLSEQYQEGQHYTWWNLSSCTETLTVMQTPQFLGTEGLRTLFSIECENGKEIKEYSYLEYENEILLPPALYFEVLGKLNPAPDLYIIHIRQIVSPYELICPPF